MHTSISRLVGAFSSLFHLPLSLRQKTSPQEAEASQQDQVVIEIDPPLEIIGKPPEGSDAISCYFPECKKLLLPEVAAWLINPQEGIEPQEGSAVYKGKHIMCGVCQHVKEIRYPVAFSVLKFGRTIVSPIPLPQPKVEEA